MKIKGEEKVLKVITGVANIFFMIVILFPLLFIGIYSLKDSTAVYEYPPKLLPQPAKSMHIVLDYSQYQPDDPQLKNLILQDATMALYATVNIFNKDSLGEIQVYGLMNGKTVFHQRAHAMKLRLELDYGEFKGVVLMDRLRLFYDDRHIKASEKVPYQYDLAGINKNYSAKNYQNSPFTSNVMKELTNEQQDRGLNGKIQGIGVHKSYLLLLENYKYYMDIPTYMFKDIPSVAKFSYFAFTFNTLMVMVWAFITQVGLCSLTAFGISRLFERKMSNLLMLYFLGTLMIPFLCILIPQAIMMRDLGVMNTYGAMLLPYLYPAAFFIFLFKGFFDNLPQDLMDAAKIDGASEWYVFAKICMPLSKSIISVVGLNVLVNAWNDFFWFMHVAKPVKLWTINLALYNISVNPSTKQNVIMGLSFITILPVIILTMIFSKQIKESVIGSAIKG